MPASAGSRVTVVIPTYNRASWLEGCLRAVVAQDFEAFTVLVSDNHSTDGTQDVVASLHDPRIRYVRREANTGLLRNHVTSISEVTDDYLMILGDDDLIQPQLLSTTVPILDAEPRIGVVHTAFDVIKSDGATVQRATNWTNGLERDAVETGAEFIRQSMRWSCRICASTALIRRAALPPGIMDRRDFPAIDFGMWLRIALDWDVAFVARNLAAYRIHAGSHSAAFGDTLVDGYVQGVELVTRLRQIKERFLTEHAGALDDRAALARVAESAARNELVVMVRNLTLPERRLSPTVAAFRAAVRIDRGVLLEVAAWRLLLASVLGGREVDRLNALGSRDRPERTPVPPGRPSR